MAPTCGKLGLIAGGGELPVLLARHCAAIGRPLFVVDLDGAADPRLAGRDRLRAGPGEVGKLVAALKAAGCASVCLAGIVPRPDFRRLKTDALGLKLLPGALAAAVKGDDALLAFLVRAFEHQGFHVEGAHEVMADLLLGKGPLGRHRPRPADQQDIARAAQAARAIGALDIGQAAVAAAGLVLAIEAQEGTDAMLRRLLDLPVHLRGTPGRRRGAIVKLAKPRQERRADLPTIGARTVELAAAAGLAGIAGEAGAVLLLEGEAVRRLADDHGLFVVGF